jgi:xanthine/uracil/vitamin C permease (AzgA family)
MMVAVFATLFAALLLALRGRQGAALVAIAACLILAIALFLYKIYSPQYGFRMPWLQTQFVPQNTVQAGSPQP